MTEYTTNEISFYMNEDDPSTVLFYIKHEDEYAARVRLDDAMEYAVRKPDLYFQPYSKNNKYCAGGAVVTEHKDDLAYTFDIITVPADAYAATLPEFVDRARQKYVDHLRSMIAHWESMADRLEAARVI